MACESNLKNDFLLEGLQIGTVKAGEHKKFKAYLHNIGKDTLIIESISAGCNCTEISLNTKKIPPKTKSDVTFTYYIREDVMSKDKIKVPVIVRSNSDREFKEFYIEGDVK